jgi:LPS O-antigen subunit length determinant protein (WzzB/FepE family)
VRSSPDRHNEGEKMELVIIVAAGLAFAIVYKLVSKREKESVLTVEHPWVFDEVKYEKIQRRLDEQLDKMWAMTK